MQSEKTFLFCGTYLRVSAINAISHIGIEPAEMDEVGHRFHNWVFVVLVGGEKILFKFDSDAEALAARGCLVDACSREIGKPEELVYDTKGNG